MATRDMQTFDRLKQTMVSFITSEGTPVERLIDAYEELSAGPHQPGANCGQLIGRAERLREDLDHYALERSMSTVMAIALMDESAVGYWATRVLGLAAEAGRCPELYTDGQMRIAGE